jgi:hypothetical protein
MRAMHPICLVMLLAGAPAAAESGLPAGTQRWPGDLPGSAGHERRAPAGDSYRAPGPGRLRLGHPLPPLLPNTLISRTAPGDGTYGRLTRREHVGVSSFTVGETPDSRVAYRSGDVILYYRILDTPHPDSSADLDGRETADISVGFPLQDAGSGVELRLIDLTFTANRSLPGHRGHHRHDTARGASDTAYRRPRSGHRQPGAGLDDFDACSVEVGFRGPCAGAFVSF